MNDKILNIPVDDYENILAFLFCMKKAQNQNIKNKKYMLKNIKL